MVEKTVGGLNLGKRKNSEVKKWLVLDREGWTNGVCTVVTILGNERREWSVLLVGREPECMGKRGSGSGKSRERFELTRGGKKKE